jgi:predicted acetyltransferase
MTIEIRPPGEDELRAAMDAAEIAFGSTEVENEDYERERKLLPASRALVAYDAGKPVGLTGAYAFDLSIPGGQLPCGGVTWVGVLPTHRRRGILSDLMLRQLQDLKTWGEPLAALWASEAAIYGRYGFGHAAANLHMKSSRARFGLRRSPGSNVRVRFVDAAEAYELYPAVYDRVRARRGGMLSRDETWWKEYRLADPESWRRGASKRFYVVVEVDSEPQAYAYYRIKEESKDGIDANEVRVTEAVAATSEAEYAVWKFLHELDLTALVETHIFDQGSSLPLVVKDPRALGLRWGDGLWLRLVDVEAALQARSYRPGQSVVLEVRDELCDWNAGRYRVGDDAGRTDAEADLVLDVADLASAYLGQFDFNRLVAAGLADERFEGAADVASALFRTELPPHCPEVF